MIYIYKYYIYIHRQRYCQCPYCKKKRKELGDVQGSTRQHGVIRGSLRDRPYSIDSRPSKRKACLPFTERLLSCACRESSNALCAGSNLQTYIPRLSTHPPSTPIASLSARYQKCKDKKKTCKLSVLQALFVVFQRLYNQRLLRKYQKDTRPYYNAAPKRCPR